MVLLKLNTNLSKPSTPATESAPVQTPGGSRLKLSLKSSVPSTPAIEQGNPLTSASKSIKSKKRLANDDLASPAAKRIASEAAGSRRQSVTLKVSQSRNDSIASQPQSAGPKLKLLKRQSSGPKLRGLIVKGQIPDRVPGNAYDSEDSERELDPATEQQLVLRMQPGEDCDYLRKAISERTLGISPQEGGAEVTFKFLDRDMQRCVVTVRKNMYAAVLVDLPCIIETMKSWDKRGWWKVADISQMLLVLGPVQSDSQARHATLPARVLNEETMAYAHGLTPPMHWVRKRRFRKRLSHKDTANVDDEVSKLLDEDAKVEREGGEVSFEITSRESLERSPGFDDYFSREEEDAVNTIEPAGGYTGYEAAEDEGMDLDDMEAMFDDDEAAKGNHNITSAALVDSPTTFADQAATIVRTDAALETPAEIPVPESAVVQDDLFGADESSDEDDDDEDDIDAFDEDAQAKAAEKNLQKQEIEDLENEIQLQKQKLGATKNQLLLNRQKEKLKSLEGDLRMKRRVYGYADEDDED
ncbi:hypothetical protein AMS68_002881 [Peltaster fructicola]|uniref:TAFII55 protein conserved region domain-containing protein n=1 Tax=Peltaster fructicola TaxID=286661 RepID=A0A6H0XRK7_9PEZI|nr:hypothetical protein AMS68_002881 [Peltaster fructicola]